MALLEQWQEYANSFGTDRQRYDTFWNGYFMQEKEIYEKLLTEEAAVTGTVKELAEKYGVDVKIMAGFLDGINDSLKAPNPLDTMEEDTQVSLL